MIAHVKKDDSVRVRYLLRVCCEFQKLGSMCYLNGPSKYLRVTGLVCYLIKVELEALIPGPQTKNVERSTKVARQFQDLVTIRERSLVPGTSSSSWVMLEYSLHVRVKGGV